MSLIIKIKRLNKKVSLPSYAYYGDAAFDLYTAEEIVFEPGKQMMVSTGVAMEIPDRYMGLIWDKSGLAIKHGLKVLGGVIDSGYRGEVMVGMINLTNEIYTIEKGHKVAQMIIQKTEMVEIEEVEELSDAQRGDKGFGSSGK